VGNADSGAETLSLRWALRWAFPCASPAPRSTEPWERSLGGLGQSRAPPLRSAQAGVELSDRGLPCRQNALIGSPSPLNKQTNNLVQNIVQNILNFLPHPFSSVLNPVVTVSLSIALAGLQQLTIPPQRPKCWHYSCPTMPSPSFAFKLTCKGGVETLVPATRPWGLLERRIVS
jgi:hypothetical protein